MTEQAPRATRADSADRKYVVMLSLDGTWVVLENINGSAAVLMGAPIPDTGQSADELLAQFQEEREEQP